MSKYLVLIISLIQMSHGAFVGVSLFDSRIQADNYVYREGGIIGGEIEVGVFNEDENILDFKSSIAISNFGYSHEFNNETNNTEYVSVDICPIDVSLTYKRVFVELDMSIGYPILYIGLSKEQKDQWYSNSATPGFLSYNYKFGYKLKNHYSIALTANYHGNVWYSSIDKAESDLRWLGGVGLNLRYNM